MRPRLKGGGAGGVLWFVSSYGSRLLVRVLEFSNPDIDLVSKDLKPAHP